MEESCAERGLLKGWFGYVKRRVTQKCRFQKEKLKVGNEKKLREVKLLVVCSLLLHQK